MPCRPLTSEERQRVRAVDTPEHRALQSANMVEEHKRRKPLAAEGKLHPVLTAETVKQEPES